MSAKIKRHVKEPVAGNRYKPRGISDRDFAKTYWPYIPVILIVGVLLSFGIGSGSLTSAVKNPAGKVLAYATHMSSGGLLEYTNNERSSEGEDALKLNSDLSRAAQSKANDMAKRNYWSHDTPDGNPPWVFVIKQDYKYQKLGENLATGFDNEKATIKGWMASLPHRENLLDPSYTEVGFGFANNPDYTSANGGPMTIVVAFYGQPASAKSSSIASINGGSKSSRPSQEFADAVTTDNVGGLTLSRETSGAQVAFAETLIQPYISALITFVLFLSVGIWVIRHLLQVRRTLVKGEAFVINHPVLDVGLIAIAIICWLLSHTSGFVI